MSTQFSGLSLQHFRNYVQRTFLFPKQTTIIVGKNTVGKTSIVEAIALLAMGGSFRAEEVEEMIQFEEEVGRVKGQVFNDEKTELEVLLTRGEVQGRKTLRMLFSVNDVRRRKKDFVGKFFTVVFRPEDMRLVEGSPARRRQFIDTILCATDQSYAGSLKTYEDALKRRNRLLLQVQENTMPRSTLTYWSMLICKHGSTIQQKRSDFFATFGGVSFPIHFSLLYKPSLINEERMAEHLEREILAGHTLTGVHKDDFEIHFNGGRDLDVAHYGSRGQQRLAVLWLKMCELDYVFQQTHSRPLLLLDDILSELDEEHREQVLSLLTVGQAIITTADERTIPEIIALAPDAEVIHL